MSEQFKQTKEAAYKRLAELRQEWLTITSENWETKAEYLYKSERELIEVIHNIENAELILAENGSTV